MKCQKAGCGEEIRPVKDGDYTFYVHVNEPKPHAAQVPLQKGSNA